MRDGARHLWHLPVSGTSGYLLKKYRDIIKPVISSNAYFASPESMLLAMLTDERFHIRKLAARRIYQRQGKLAQMEIVCRFVIPAVNFGATDYVDHIDWQVCYVTSPSVLKKISSHEF
ncbi:hypothetical protein AVEN_227972-1 [Araneus ventricosus]|uniref:Uncharacterized protein n=1 Tax=Araneus ventricosus TaxID=182803 RepID=A0A4Y2TBN5_ARAVE|nr:hypothetical protein AVEN_227972-1 [Araneus ventricosus]